MRFGILGPFEVTDDQGRELALGVASSGRRTDAVVGLIWRSVLPPDRDDLARLDRAIRRVDGVQTVSDLVGDALSADAAVCVR
jgi:hypothetical protein